MRTSIETGLREMAGFSRVVIGVDIVLLLLLVASLPAALSGDGPFVVWLLGLCVVLASLTVALVAVRRHSK